MKLLSFCSAAAPFQLLLNRTLRPSGHAHRAFKPLPAWAPRWFHFLDVRYFSVFGVPSVTCFIVAVCFLLSACFLTCSPPHISWKPASLPAAPPCWCSRARRHAPTARGSVWSPHLYLNSTRRNYTIRNTIFQSFKENICIYLTKY